MINVQHGKVTADHQKRTAFLYVRQSTIRQVFENTESTKRQYALKERAIALGWPLGQIVVIDDDLGKSGARSDNRGGFQKLVSEVGLGNAGLVMGLEVSRLARNSADWHRLLEICALTNTLILDEDGIYKPTDFNDRMLLGMKGNLSEAELHLLKSRLQGGILSKAKRGELKNALPIGLVYDAKMDVALDTDSQVQETMKTFFRVFERVGSATATVKYFQQKEINFPRQIRSGTRKGEVAWRDLTHWKALQTLHVLTLHS
jgi:DNA invertase Pin-like site-specific DNA recombinase